MALVQKIMRQKKLKKNEKKHTWSDMVLSRPGRDSDTQEPVTSNVRVLAQQIRCVKKIGENVVTVTFSPLPL